MEEGKSEPKDKEINFEHPPGSMQHQEGADAQSETLTRAQRRKLKRKLFKGERSLEREKKVRKKKIYTILFITLFVIIISTGIFYKINKSKNYEQLIADIQPTGETKEFNIIARQFSFSPSTIEVNRGDTVKLTVTSMDVTHGIAITQYGIDKRLPPNSPVDIEFIANKPGKFPFVCSVPCGRGHAGMSGTLVVK